MSESVVKRWLQLFNNGEENVDDLQRQKALSCKVLRIYEEFWKESQKKHTHTRTLSEELKSFEPYLATLEN